MLAPNLERIGIHTDRINQHAFAEAMHGQIRWLPKFTVGQALGSADWALSIQNSQVVNQARRLDATLGGTMAAVSPFTAEQTIPALLDIYAGFGQSYSPAERADFLMPLVAEHEFYNAYNDQWLRFPRRMDRMRNRAGVRVASAIHGWLEQAVKQLDEPLDERMAGGSLAGAIVRSVLEMRSA